MSPPPDDVSAPRAPAPPAKAGLRPILGIVRKDLLVHLNDRRALLMSFALPAVLATFFSFAFQSSGGDVRQLHVPIAVVDEEGSEASRALVAALVADPTLTARAMTRAEAEDVVRAGKLDVAIVLPPGFTTATRARLSGEALEPPVLPILFDPAAARTLGLATGLVQKRIVDALASPAAKARLATCSDMAAPYRAEPRPASVDHFDGGGHAVAGMAVQFILMLAIDNAVVLLTERQRGLWRRVRATPITRRRVLLARIISSALIALMTLTFMVLFGHFALGVALNGSLIGLVLVGVSFALMAATIGLFATTLGKTPQATRGAGIFVILILVMLGGAWFPTMLMPPWMQSVTQAMPTRWAVDGLDAMMWRGGGLEAALLPSALMLGLAALLAVFSAWRFRWEE